MAAAIVDFLQSATSLHQQVSRAEINAEGGFVVVHNAPRWVRDFEALAKRLSSSSATAGLQDPAGGKPLHALSKACWKVSQDVILRLKAAEDATGRVDEPGSELADLPIAAAAFPVDVFGSRLSELRDQWSVVQPSPTDDLVGISDTLTRLDIFNVHEVSAPEQSSQGPEDRKAVEGGAPSRLRPVPAGILNDFILESLSFRSMRNREEEVADAHGNTFDWIFNGPPSKGREAKNELGDHFTRWMGGNDLGSIYWVTGKPGSGKSTLMRYISEHESTLKLLGSWAGKNELVRANFYFWTSGSEEQRSQTGLLRYLLHQMLSHDMSLIAKVFPQLWQQLSRMTTKERIQFALEWTTQDLMEGFRLFLKHALPTKKICLFIDGLDEFDGDHRGIIHFFKELAEGPSKARIKMCLSSRPWEVFEKAFENTVPNLKLQDLTFQDMFQYVHDNLPQGRNLKKLLSQDPENYEPLTRQIVQQADGVFLWVRLVVRKIRELFDKPETTVSEIQTFVRTLPTELDELFDKLLFESRSEAALAESSHIFQLIRAREVVADFIKDESANSLTIWEFAFAMQPEDDDLALHGQVAETADEDIVKRCMTTGSHILSQSAGLLEIYSKRDHGNAFRGARFENNVAKLARMYAANRVTYLHRTVRDYLMLAPTVWDRLISQSSAKFDPHLRLLRSHVLRLKHALEEIEHHRRLDEWYPDITLSLTHSRHVSTDPSGLRTPLINELDKTMSWYWLARSGDPYDHWARGCFGTYEERKGNKMILPKPFILLCTKFGLEEYVLETLDDLAKRGENLFPVFDEDEEDEEDNEPEPLLTIEETPLLKYALEFLTSRQKTLFPLSSPSFVLSLLNSPHRTNPALKAFIGSPNISYTSPLTNRKNVTPWLMVLRHLRDAKRRGWIEPFDIDANGTERWVRIVRILIESGDADLEAYLKPDIWDEGASARDVLVGTQQLGAIGDWWIHGLRDYFKSE